MGYRVSRRRNPCLFLYWLLTVFSMSTAATDYCVSDGGDDNNTGTSPGAAWQTLAPLNTLDMDAGDRMLLDWTGLDWTGLHWIACSSIAHRLLFVKRAKV